MNLQQYTKLTIFCFQHFMRLQKRIRDREIIVRESDDCEVLLERAFGAELLSVDADWHERFIRKLKKDSKNFSKRISPVKFAEIFEICAPALAEFNHH